ncbi:calcium-binding protein [Roseicella frigidaeris]|uniref:Haemolysin-type calcium binding-related domain-containing protein n=1 Tax=Roseicella frigidaeris TaxID=2230885 RepID=A0A327M9D7_9PROT|nr:calcium-binding protein [Roseicella frigidaeris]RAI59016.1 hypothetical protein DOO78_10785 [Roseicella frigidaeris]
MIINGTAASETLAGTAQDDVITGFGGNDTLSGGDGNDIYIFSGGFGRDQIRDTSGLDQIQFGLDYTDANFRLVRDGADLLIRQNGGDNQIELNNYFGTTTPRGAIETVYFPASNVTWNLADGSAFLTVGFIGTSASETVAGSPGADFLAGLGGNDTMLGYDGDDTYFVSGAFGRDTITDSSGVDILIVGRDWTEAYFQFTRPNNGADLVMQTPGGVNSINFNNYYSTSQSAQKVESFISRRRVRYGICPPARSPSSPAISTMEDTTPPIRRSVVPASTPSATT